MHAPPAISPTRRPVECGDAGARTVEEKPAAVASFESTSPNTGPQAGEERRHSDTGRRAARACTARARGPRDTRTRPANVRPIVGDVHPMRRSVRVSSARRAGSAQETRATRA